MADKKVTQAKTVLQVHHQVEHLGLHRHIQSAHRLVGHDERRSGDQGPSDGDALALAAREFMWVFVEV